MDGNAAAWARMNAMNTVVPERMYATYTAASAIAG